MHYFQNTLLQIASEFKEMLGVERYRLVIVDFNKLKLAVEEMMPGSPSEVSIISPH